MQRPSCRDRGVVRSGWLLAVVAAALCGGAGPEAGTAEGTDFEMFLQPARTASARVVAWYQRTRPSDRVAWGGLGACAGLGLFVMLERLMRLRMGRTLPRDFSSRFLRRMQDGKLDRGKALDFCELNPSPAARVALGAVRRWDRPVTDQERAVTLAVRVEADRLRRNLGTLRRIAALAPLLGLLGSLMAVGRVLATANGATAWGPALAQAITPLTAGVALAILSLVAYDGLTGRFETLVGHLERIGAETIDAIAMNMPAEPRGGRTPHSIRVEIPESQLRPVDREAEYL